MRQRAKAEGITDATFNRAFEGVAFDVRILQLDQNQPESKTEFSKYLDRRLPPRIHTARKKAKEHYRLLDSIQSRYGVKKAFILSLWGLESNFGAHMGNFNVIRSLASLAFQGRRQAFFTNELIEALKILQESREKIKDLKGSWAGAMGQCQFMPSAFNLHAVDTSQKGLKDIWQNPEDVFTSIANYLVNSGWQTNQPWGVEVVLPKGFKKSRANIHIERSRDYWAKLGIKPKNTKKHLANLPGALIIPDGKDRAFVVYNNFRVILKWNRSICFALTVCLFADEISQENW